MSTPPVINPDCGTTLWIEFKTTGGKRVVSTPAKCNGKNATGKLSYIRTPSCNVNTPKTFKSTGFKLDASFAINVSDLLSIEGDSEYCASDNHTILNAVGEGDNWTEYLWSNDETTQMIEATEGTYTVTATDSEGLTATAKVTVIQNENPIPSITGDLEYCPSDLTTTVDAGDWVSYSWSDNQTSQMIEVAKEIIRSQSQTPIAALEPTK